MQALKFTYINQIARLAGGPVILVLLPFFLSIEQQGYWFTMISLTAFIAFADMGLSTVLIHSAAHEHAKYEQLQSPNCADSIHYITRLDTLRIFAWRRSLLVALWILPTVLVIGFYMLSRQTTEEAIYWEMPWILLCITSVASLVLNMILAYYEGCNDVAGIQRMRAVMALLNVLLLALGLVFGLGLWSLPFAIGASTAVGYAFILKKSRTQNVHGLDITSSAINAGVRDWSSEISPLLTKYAASWIGGYAMFQLFTPIVFSLEGATAAGRVGLTISVFTAIFTLANVWSTYQLPRFAIAIASRDCNALNNCLTIAIKGSLFTYCILVSIAGVVYLSLREFTHFWDRFLGIEGIITLALVWFMQLLVHNLSVYLRAFREEPLVWYTLIAAGHSIVVTLVTLQLFGLNYLFGGFLTVYIWFAPAVFLLFVRKRESTKNWHELIK